VLEPERGRGSQSLYWTNDILEEGKKKIGSSGRLSKTKSRRRGSGLGLFLIALKRRKILKSRTVSEGHLVRGLV